MENQEKVNYSLQKLISEDEARLPVLNFLNYYSSNLRESSDVLELGCGNGRNLQIFANCSHRVYGIDGLHEAVDHCENIGISAKQENLDDDFVMDRKFDVILILDVLEHLMNPHSLLKKAKSLLKNDGRILINVPNHFALQGRVRIFLGSGIDSEGYFPNDAQWTYPHIRFFTHAGILNMVRHCELSLCGDYSKRFLRTPRIPFLNSAIKVIWEKLPVDLSCGGFMLELK